MLLEISTTHKPATDLGFLLHKHPDRVQEIKLALGKAHIFYPEATENCCSICLLLDINPIEVMKSKKGMRSFLKENYVNDRTYTSNSFMSTAIVKAFGSAINGTCHTRPELPEIQMPFEIKLHAINVENENQIDKLFEPLGYKIEYQKYDVDNQFPKWGKSKTVTLSLKKTTTLQELLSQLYVFILVLDNQRHYWIGNQEIDLLKRRGTGWLGSHPEKEWIVKRFLKYIPELTYSAKLNILQDEDVEDNEKQKKEKEPNLHQKRLLKAFQLIKNSHSETVLDVGCGEGKLLKLLLKDSQFKKIGGTDVAFSELQRANEKLYLDTASPYIKDKITLFQSSLTYQDERFLDYDAIALVEVIEHIDEERLEVFERTIFNYARPKTVVLSTPNSEYNVTFEKLYAKEFRHDDHRFEWSRKEFKNWCQKISETYNYSFEIFPVGEEKENVGAPSQIVIFKK
ncbi:3' terminal RNA ribose 2'-O-methyltransferase Hen1 [Bernardetia litoralis DSM 6794]|uniref:Small RNA 2'-O-methyltransferase n=1 Tax=Bernardetia litoralis (strain ATCC 23117 / DSM 6794 / NBRC 15988 / NCIMB 1366 / Fx l1 / Sio-4) TaxID=880071 RepID=I4AH23_BERLS|nr:3' terminal RNA ribose 2'-O-methyltransferase Hen1 [Bernardetia litoralis]AFM03258.1 3' terminal RNA ribose 2'-O-methyltransferase Hen1 [Bernardetia litoralis DSM 6794]